MKVSILLSLVALTRCAISGSLRFSDTPLLGHDPDTVEKCASWYNNAYGESCEYVRDNYDITPELFHAWNPSIGLDCAPWYYASYCILSQERLDEYNKEHPTSTTTSVAISTTATTTSAPTLGPSPTSWTALGCYIEYPAVPILQLNMNPTGDASLSVPKCQQSCYRRAYNFAGVQEGNQCWCGSYVGGEVAKNQTECNTPCTGDKSIFCGGKGRINIFKAEKNGVPPSSTGSQTQTSTTTTKPSTTQPSNGITTPLKTSPDGSCGNLYTCNGYPSLSGYSCCNQYGRCGDSAADCGAGCKSSHSSPEFCKSGVKPSTTSTSAAPSATSTLKTSPDGTCGNLYTCNGYPSLSGYSCCNQYGRCGDSAADCGIGCKASHSSDGKCDPTTTKPVTAPPAAPGLVTSPNGMCGILYTCTGLVNTLGYSCCSQYGYCGDSVEHCGTGCKKGYGACL